MARQARIPDTQPQSEADIRVDILNTLLTCPHRDVAGLIKIHQDMAKLDPLFYAHLGIWAQANTEVRDHKELFCASMFIFDNEFPEVREAAYCLLQNFPPYQINRIIDHIKGKTVIAGDKTKSYDQRFGKNLPRVFRSALIAYLRKREENRDWFDKAAIRDRKALTSLYARGRIGPGTDHVRGVLFPDDSNEPDKDSLFAKTRSVIEESDSTKQAELIVELKIPFPVAIGMVNEVTPTILIALINNMTGPELLANLNSIKSKGAFKNTEVKKLVSSKMKKAGKNKKVDALKASKVASQVKDLDDETRADLESVSDERVRSIQIHRSTALFIDKSASMDRAIEVAKEIGAAISGACTGDFFCYAFDRNAIPINCDSARLSEWTHAMRGIRAQGGTAIGAPLSVMNTGKQIVEQIVIISDFDERNAPRFFDEYDRYAQAMEIRPYVVMVTVPGFYSSYWNPFSKELERRKIEHDMYDASSNKIDYYSLPTLLRFLTRKSKFELVQEIFATPLPTKANL